MKFWKNEIQKEVDIVVLQMIVYFGVIVGVIAFIFIRNIYLSFFPLVILLFLWISGVIFFNFIWRKD